jgi:cell division septation protein DedD
VPNLSHHDADDGFHEIQLSGKQLVFLFMATTVVLVVTFLCGVLVGRGVRTDRVVAAAEPVASAATPASTPAPAPPSTAAGPPAAEPPPPANEDDDLSYHKRLESEKPAAEKLKADKSKAAAPAPAPAPAPREAKPEAKPDTRAAVPAPAASARPGVWVVQVVALKDRAAASAVVDRLSGKGYPAFLVNPAADAPVIYRVQVGRYDDRGQAEETARRLKKEEQFNPWISR